MKQVAKLGLNDLLPVGLTVVVTAIILAFGLQVMGESRNDMCGNGANALGQCLNSTGGTGNVDLTADYNATTQGMSAVAKLPAKLGTVVTVVLAAIIIGILIRYFMAS